MPYSAPVQLALHTGELQQRLELGTENQSAIELSIEKRFDAQSIARHQQALLNGIPQRERKHPLQMIQAGVAILLIKMNDDFSVARGAEDMPPQRQVATNLPEIIDFA